MTMSRFIGFTLVELLAVMAVLAIALSVAFPSMRYLLYKTEMRAQLSRLLAGINLIRSEAVARNIPVTMCPSLAPTSVVPICSGSYNDGWIVFSNPNTDAVVDPGTDEVVVVSEGLPDGYSWMNRAGNKTAKERISYFSDGSSSSARTLMICSPAGSGIPSRSIVMNRVGRARQAVGWGLCP
ncbi:MAG: type IV fimbrial biogenesis protein FimT [Halioglobus sp.]|jgi:type IV fimbrial biogenesis protein FimT